MKKTLTFLSIVACGVLFMTAMSQAQMVTGRGDFFNITRTIDQTADSVTFVADTLTVFDSGTGVDDFVSNDSVAIMFVQNRFKIVNNMLTTTQFDYIRARVTNTGSMTIRRQAYNGVITNTTGGVPVLGTDGAQTGTDIGLRPVYRPVGNIASSSPFNSDPSAIRQFLTFQVLNPEPGMDGVQIRNIFFKPNINNLTGLAAPPDTTKDTLRAYHLDGTGIAAGDVVDNGMADLAIVRLLPGTTRILMWVKDSAQAVDAGEYFGSFGDYSRGRYFLGDDGLPMADSRTMQFRPSATNANWGPGVGNPDEGLIVDGFPPERNPIRLSKLYQTLAPFWYNADFPNTYPAIPGDPCANPNPENGLIPPYRVGAYAVAHNPYQPGLVSSALDTLRFFDAYGNRTWDRITQPKLSALGYNQNTAAVGSPLDRTVYLRGYSEATDTLRQFGQIVYRRLAYVAADMQTNAGGVEDSVRILATAKVKYRGLGAIPQELDALADTSGGFPRTWSYSERLVEAHLDNGPRTNVTWQIDDDRTAVDPLGVNSLPNSGVKITVRPNIPRAIELTANDQWQPRGILENRNLRMQILVADGFGNTVDDNEKFKYEQSPYGKTTFGTKYRLGGIFDSLVAQNPNVQLSSFLIDSGRVNATGGAGILGTSNNTVFRPASGANNVGWYRIRVRSTYSFPDHGGFTDLHTPLKLDPFPLGNPPTIGGFAHIVAIPDGSPNNNFGPVFGPNALVGCPSIDAGFGKPMGQTTAIDSIDVHWDGTEWFIPFKGQRWPRLEVVCGNDDALVVGTVGTFTLPGQQPNIYDRLFVRLVDIHGNPMDIAPYFDPTNGANNNIWVELPENPQYIQAFTLGQTDKVFFGSVSPNVALSGPGGSDNPTNINSDFTPKDPNNPTQDLLAELVNVQPGQKLPGIDNDILAPVEYNAVRFYVWAPRNVKRLSLSGVDVIPVRAHLTLSPNPNAEGIAVASGLCEINIIPDVVQTVEVFKSWGKPQGTTEPLGTWGPGTVNDRAAEYYPTGTPRNAAEVNEFYKGYFFRAIGAAVPSTDATFPTPVEPGAEIGGFLADDVSLDGDATAPIPMDTVVVSEHDQQIRVVARLLDRFRNPIGGRLVKFHVESETLPVTPPKTALQNNTQRGGFGEFGNINVADDTLKRSTIGDTAQAGWVTAFFVSGRVGHQMVRIALTPDTLAFDLAPGVGDDLGEGTIVGPSARGFAPRVIIPIYQRPDTTVRVEIYPYTAGVTSPIPLPADLVDLQSLEHESVYFGPGIVATYAPRFKAYSANPFFNTEKRATRFGRSANTNVRPYIPDTLNLVDTDPMNPNTITAGRKITLLVREYDKFGNLKDNSTDAEDTARIRFRMWNENFGNPYPPYDQAGPGTIAPALNWTNDEFGPMRKIRMRHTQISNLVSGVHINQTVFLSALEFPTPKIINSTHFFEATATAVLRGQGVVELDRDTIKVTAITKEPTRFDILRAGQEFPRGSVGEIPLTGTPENRTLDVFAPRTIELPPGSDPINHNLDAQGVDNILLSQVYKRNVSPYMVGHYEIVDENNVPLDIDGDPLYDAADATTINPDFNLREYTGLPDLVKLHAYNNQNPLTSPNIRYNVLNQNAPPGFQMPPGFRNDGVIFEVTMAGGGDGIGTSIGSALDLKGGADPWPQTATAPNDRRPVLFRITPIWENNPPTGGNTYDLALFSGNNAQPGQTREYPQQGQNLSMRLYADTIYTYTGSIGAPPRKTNTTHAEIMGTRTDRGFAGRMQPGGEFDRITRVGVRGWSNLDFHRAGFTRGEFDIPNVYRTANAFGITGGETNTGLFFDGDYGRRVILMGGGFGRERTAPGYIAPGAFLALIDSTTEQVIDLRVIDPNLTDMAGNTVDDTCSYDRGKWTVVRRANRTANRYWHYDDTYYDDNAADIPGPNFSSAQFLGEQYYDLKGRPVAYGTIDANQVSILRSFFGQSSVSKQLHTFVVVPYRIAFVSIFPSSFDVSQGTNLLDKLPLGILPHQADIDTIPRIRLIPPIGADLTTYETFTRTYGQIVHGSTDQIPNNANQPYARPDTIFRDLIYTYALTPYDRYGNINPRDSIWVQLGSRFGSANWNFSFGNVGGGADVLLIKDGGTYFNATPVLTPTNENYRQDSIHIYNPIQDGNSNNRYLGIKPDDKRLGITVGEPGGLSIVHGLIPANIMSTRPVSVKKPFRPADFTLSAPGINNKDLFRMDHTGGCDTAGIELDILRLGWEASEWPAGSGMANPNDTIKYEWYAIIDSVSGTTGQPSTMIVSRLADDDGKSNSITIPGDELRDLVFRPNVQPQPNADSLVMRLKWFVRAYSKTGLEAFSDTAGVTIRNNPLPIPALIVSINRAPENPPTPNTPTDGQVVSGIGPGMNPIDVIWNPSTDINVDKGHLIGGFETYDPISQTWSTVLNAQGLGQRTVDTVLYQWVGRVSRTFPAGKGAPLFSTLVVNTGSQTGFQLTEADFDALFAGFDPDPASASADSVCVEWWAIAKDFQFEDVEITFPYEEGLFVSDSVAGDMKAVRADSGMFSWTSCRPHWIKGGPYEVCFTRLGDGGVEIDPSQATNSNPIEKIVGEEVCFTLTAKDDQGQIIRDWDVTGRDTELIIKGSTANTDSSDMSWNADPDGYTFAIIKESGQVLTQLDSVTFVIPPDAFVEGVATICFVHTAANNGVTIEIGEKFAFLNQVSQPMNFTADAITNYLVDITPATADPNQVYKFRKYEVVVYPRDRYMNVSNKQIATKFSARFPGEYVDSRPDLSNIFSGEVFISGPTNYFLASTTSRFIGGPRDQLQTITAYNSNDPSIRGITDPYEILEHPPDPFALLDPPDHTHLTLVGYSTPQAFDWEVSTDPYTNIAISRFTTEIGNDIVKYRIVFVDSASLTNRIDIDSDNLGLNDAYNTTHGQLKAISEQIAGGPTLAQNVVWFVEAYDDLYITKSDPDPGHHLYIDNQNIVSIGDMDVPTEYNLEQNYPNPFNPTTSIEYSVPNRTQVTMVVYDLLGNHVKTVVDDVQKPGVYQVVWDATNESGEVVPTGNYILKMVAGDFTQTRKMTLVK
ncbi:MAG: hypothetical protein CL946_06540 [Ectothiorhodospiraceae bacterium]|nr:hypothetical protein [Ectothiorhodospiraceae bacterium]